ncbi:hypothetical protein AI27_17835 [Sphingomonas sp. BHC-A]|nr:hypothetical protein AI27_17835 [Sphingomonas sp. BHC-A]
MKKLALLGLALLAACAGAPTLDQPTAIATLRLSGDGGVAASAVIESRDRKPAWARLYVVPAAYADDAQRAIAADGGRLGRWAMIPVISQSMDGDRSERVRLVPPPWAAQRGDLMVLAIDPISPGRFVASDAAISQARYDGEVR